MLKRIVFICTLYDQSDPSIHARVMEVRALQLTWLLCDKRASWVSRLLFSSAPSVHHKFWCYDQSHPSIHARVMEVRALELTCCYVINVPLGSWDDCFHLHLRYTTCFVVMINLTLGYMQESWRSERYSWHGCCVINVPLGSWDDCWGLSWILRWLMGPLREMSHVKK